MPADGSEPKGTSEGLLEWKMQAEQYQKDAKELKAGGAENEPPVLSWASANLIFDLELFNSHLGLTAPEIRQRFAEATGIHDDYKSPHTKRAFSKSLMDAAVRHLPNLEGDQFRFKLKSSSLETRYCARPRLESDGTDEFGTEQGLAEWTALRDAETGGLDSTDHLHSPQVLAWVAEYLIFDLQLHNTRDALTAQGIREQFQASTGIDVTRGGVRAAFARFIMDAASRQLPGVDQEQLRFKLFSLGVDTRYCARLRMPADLSELHGTEAGHVEWISSRVADDTEKGAKEDGDSPVVAWALAHLVFDLSLRETVGGMSGAEVREQYASFSGTEISNTSGYMAFSRDLNRAAVIRLPGLDLSEFRFKLRGNTGAAETQRYCARLRMASDGTDANGNATGLAEWMSFREAAEDDEDSESTIGAWALAHLVFDQSLRDTHGGMMVAEVREQYTSFSGVDINGAANMNAFSRALNRAAATRLPGFDASEFRFKLRGNGGAESQRCCARLRMAADEGDPNGNKAGLAEWTKLLEMSSLA